MIDKYKKTLKKSILILEEDNDFIIDSFLIRITVRIINAFKQNDINMNKRVIENITNELLLNMLHNVNKENSNKIEKTLENIYNNLNAQIRNSISKERLKELIKLLIIKIKKSSKSINIFNFNNYIDSIKSKAQIYDNAKLNIDLNTIFEKEVNDIVEVINENNNDFILKEINYILKDIIN